MNSPEQSRPGLPMLDGVGITPQAEGAPAEPAVPELPGEYQPRQAPIDPALVERAAEELDTGRHLLLLRVFGLMVGALLLTAAVAWWMSSQIVSSTSFPEIALRQVNLQVLFFFELAAVMYLARMVAKLNATMAALILIAFAAFNGVSFSIFAAVIPPSAIAYAFLITALTFGAMFFYGYHTKMDLGRMRAWAYMMGVGVALALLGMVLFGTPVTYLAAAVLGVLFFSNLVAYHAAEIEDMYMEFDNDPNGWTAALCGALLLYLNFVNLYILILSAMSRARGWVNRKD